METTSEDFCEAMGSEAENTNKIIMVCKRYKEQPWVAHDVICFDSFLDRKMLER